MEQDNSKTQRQKTLEDQQAQLAEALENNELLKKEKLVLENYILFCVKWLKSSNVWAGIPQSSVKDRLEEITAGK